MRHTTHWLATFLLVLPALALAQAPDAGAEVIATEQQLLEAEASLEAEEAARKAAEARREADEQALEARLEQAQKSMEAAAREIAVLSTQLAGDVTAFAMSSVFGTEPRPMLGVNIGESDHLGVPILGVTPDGPADEAGLRAGDVLVSVDDVSLVDDNTDSGSNKLTEKMKTATSGEALRVTYLRGGLEQEVTVTPRDFGPGELLLAMGDLGDLNIDLEDFAQLEVLQQLGSLDELQRLGHGAFQGLLGGAGRWSDMELVTISPDLGGYFGTEEGILVVKAPADPSLQLKDGDVLLDIGGRRPTSPEHAMRILRSYEVGETLDLVVVRERSPLQLDIRVPPPEAPPVPPAPPAPLEPEQNLKSPAEPARFHREPRFDREPRIDRELIIEAPEQA